MRLPPKARDGPSGLHHVIVAAIVLLLSVKRPLLIAVEP